VSITFNVRLRRYRHSEHRDGAGVGRSFPEHVETPIRRDHDGDVLRLSRKTRTDPNDASDRVLKILQGRGEQIRRRTVTLRSTRILALAGNIFNRSSGR